MVRREGRWGKLCAKGVVGNDSAPERVPEQDKVGSWGPLQLGEVVCRALTFSGVETAQLATDEQRVADDSPFFETASVNATEQNKGRQQTFVESTCPSRQVLRVSCKSLQCGERPQATSHWARSAVAAGPVVATSTASSAASSAAGRRARIVGGTNSGPGAWPWQAALYKEGEFQCGATLISDRWLLSAGHCFY
ncbi:transmembrane protease serine 9-like, partial [Frankliniella occidentalis]|uniref:Transmembrane protease serine 9-like n=1 Tax=Frankliniella occidentalis TaxID=133901 RepID=A0A9C6XAZ2_FRAOC